MIRKTVTSTQLFLVIACLGLSLQFAYAGEIYRWVDENGIVNYAEKAPKGKPATTVKPDTRMVGTTTPENTINEPTPTAENQTNTPVEPKKSKREIREARADKCAKARDNISRLEPSYRVMVAGEDGEPKILETEKRMEWLQRSKEAEAEYCDESLPDPNSTSR